MRARLGRPKSKGVVVIAVLGALTVGFLGAQLGAWAAWHTARSLPDEPTAIAIDRLVAPDASPADRYRRDELFYFTPANDYDFGSAQPGAVRAYHVSASHQALTEAAFAVAARARLQDAGWKVSDVITGRGMLASYADTNTTLYAERDGLVIEVTNSLHESPHVVVAIYRAEPVLVPIAQMLGALLGAMAGWLMIGWASRRLTGRHTALTAIIILGLAAVLAAALPAIAFALLAEISTTILRPTWTPAPSFLAFAYSFAWPIAGLAALIALAAVGLAILRAHPSPARRHQEPTGPRTRTR